MVRDTSTPSPVRKCLPFLVAGSCSSRFLSLPISRHFSFLHLRSLTTLSALPVCKTLETHWQFGRAHSGHRVSKIRKRLPVLGTTWWWCGGSSYFWLPRCPIRFPLEKRAWCSLTASFLSDLLYIPLPFLHTLTDCTQSFFSSLKMLPHLLHLLCYILA